MPRESIPPTVKVGPHAKASSDTFKVDEINHLPLKSIIGYYGIQLNFPVAVKMRTVD